MLRISYTCNCVSFARSFPRKTSPNKLFLRKTTNFVYMELLLSINLNSLQNEKWKRFLSNIFCIVLFFIRFFLKMTKKTLISGLDFSFAFSLYLWKICMWKVSTFYNKEFENDEGKLFTGKLFHSFFVFAQCPFH